MPTTASRLLSAYGIPYLRSIVATSSVAAVQAAAGLGYPVAVKIDVPGVVHKTDVGGVQLGLVSAEAVAAATDACWQGSARRRP